MNRISSIFLLIIFFFNCGSSFLSRKWLSSPLLMKRSSVCYQHVGRFIPEDFYSRLNEGMVSYQELEPIFPITKDRLLDINKVGAKGFIGFIMNFENSLIDAKPMYEACFSKLSMLFNQPKPIDSNLRETIGIPLSDGLRKLGWEFGADEDQSKCEQEFYELVKQYVQKNAIKIAPYAAEMLEQILRDQNDISVISFLPRDIVQYLFTKTSLVRFFKGIVPPKQLITLPPLSQLTFDSTSKASIRDSDADSFMKVYSYSTGRSRFEGAAFVKSRYIAACGYMHKLPCECLLIDGIIDHIVLGKQLGMSCIALEGFTNQISSLRLANRIISSFKDLNMEDLYKIAQKTINTAQGPEKQLQLVTQTKPNLTRFRVRTPVVTTRKMLKRKIIALLVQMQLLQANNITITEEIIKKYSEAAAIAQVVKEVPTIYDYRTSRKESADYADRNDDHDSDNETHHYMKEKKSSTKVEGQGMRYFDNDEEELQDDDDDEEEVTEEETPEQKQFVYKQLNKFYSLLKQVESLHKRIQTESKYESGMNNMEAISSNEQDGKPLDMENLQTTLIKSLINLERARISEGKEEEEEDDAKADAAYLVRDLTEDNAIDFSSNEKHNENEDKPTIYDYQFWRKSSFV